MATKSRAERIGLRKVRNNPSHDIPLLPQPSSLADSHSASSSNNTNPDVCRIPSPNLTAKAPDSSVDSGASQTGACTVCKRQVHIVNTTGLLRNHGPRGNECKGSRSRPFPGSQQLAPSHITCATRQTIQSAPSSSLPPAAGAAARTDS